MIKIGAKEISKGGVPFLIAEVGINHNGELDKAFNMIKVAKEVGADAVKFQTFKADELVGNAEQLFTYQSQGKPVTESMLEMFKRYEFSRDQWFMIRERCDKTGIQFLSSPQNVSDLNLLLELGIDAIKIGSDDFTNIPLIHAYAASKLPIILSCGMADLDEVKASLNTVGFNEGYPAALLLCTSEYPTPPEDVNLLKLRTLHENFPDLILGFSDHTQGHLAASIAVGMGAVIFEKHFTLDHHLPGPDHWFSETPETLKQWIESIRNSYQMMGSAIVKPTDSEREMRTLARRSVVAIININSGDIFTQSNIALRRPGNGIPPSKFDEIIGKKAIHNYKKGTLISKEEIE
jgi:N,N'-diacetyllegionaminate synthase